MKTFALSIRLKGFTHFDMFTVVHSQRGRSDLESGGAGGRGKHKNVVVGREVFLWKTWNCSEMHFGALYTIL